MACTCTAQPACITQVGPVAEIRQHRGRRHCLRGRPACASYFSEGEMLSSRRLLLSCSCSCCRVSNVECPTLLSRSVWRPRLQDSGCEQMRHSLQCLDMPCSHATSRFQVKRDGPRAASKRVREENSTPQQMESWLKKAVADSLLGSCPKSRRRFLSAWAA